MKGPNERVGELTSTDSDCSYLGEANCFASVQGEANSFASVQGEAKLLCFKVRQIAMLQGEANCFAFQTRENGELQEGSTFNNQDEQTKITKK